MMFPLARQARAILQHWISRSKAQACAIARIV
jgi:hypothetical protein